MSGPKVSLLEMILDDEAEERRLAWWRDNVESEEAKRWVSRRLLIVTRRRETLDLVLKYQFEIVQLIEARKEGARRAERIRGPQGETAEPETAEPEPQAIDEASA